MMIDGVCQRCGVSDEDHGDLCVVDGVKLVRCDEATCRAVEDPQTNEEYRAAYEHWRRHSKYYGCSHGR